MKTTNLTEALTLLDDYINEYEYLGEGQDQAIAQLAQKELADIQRLVSVVQGFVKENDICKAIDEIYDDNRAVSKLLSNVCDIVGSED